ncbi:hypothetical protein A7U60_g5103 [Sanghuangporus baumii]|uniref:Xylanolytic transcriptional activator regulatory domain-containing protein n=1 Tax=Sanghuangporus baumii TaxID=108892 RepID=A0A9Q5N451_SANBA|nr:hypothetical protein A7U60_g5103 [Sanghuangporus baumii]
MPPLSSHQIAHQAAAVNGKNLEKDTVELKRAKGEISCAECRRLKLRCDKKARGARFILADTDKLHRKIAEMSNRIRQLEDALANAQATISRDPHPMLSPDLLAIKHRLPSPADDDLRSQANTNDRIDGDIMNSFEDLSLGETSASGEPLLLSNVYKNEPLKLAESVTEVMDEDPLPVEIEHLSGAFPFSLLYLPKEDIQRTIQAHLPTYERALDLCGQYIQYAAWWIRPVGYDHIYEELLPAAYRRQTRGTQAGFESESKIDSAKMDSHDLAVLLMVLAMGSAGGLLTNPCSEGEIYLRLARAALCLKPVLEFPSIAAVQAICLMASFDMIPRRKRSLEPASKSVSFAMMLAVNIGLHKDPSHWKFNPKIAQRRRELFWELLYVDAWKSVASGRPTGVHPDDIDCELPFDKEASLDEHGKEIPSFWHVKYQYLRDVFLEVVRKLNFSKPLRYSEILELDGKVREFGPRSMTRQAVKSIGSGNSVAPEDIRAYLQKYMLSMLKDITLQLLHRNFFARALLKNPKNPMQSAFAPSFLSCYNSAISILRVVRDHYDGISTVIIPYWSSWTFTPISAIVLGSVAAYAPALDLSPRAYMDLVTSIDAFEKAQSLPLIGAAFPVILRLLRALLQACLGLCLCQSRRDALYPEGHSSLEKGGGEQDLTGKRSPDDHHMDAPAGMELSNNCSHSGQMSRSGSNEPSTTSSNAIPALPSSAGHDITNSLGEVNTTPLTQTGEDTAKELVPSPERSDFDYQGIVSSSGLCAFNEMETSLSLGREDELLHSALPISQTFPTFRHQTNVPSLSQATSQSQTQGWPTSERIYDALINDTGGATGNQYAQNSASLSVPSSSFTITADFGDLAGQVDGALNGVGTEISDFSSAFGDMQDSDFMTLLSMSMGEGALWNGVADAQQGGQCASNLRADMNWPGDTLGGNDNAPADPLVGIRGVADLNLTRSPAHAATLPYECDSARVVDGACPYPGQPGPTVSIELESVLRMYGW